KTTGKKLSELAGVMTVFPQVLVNVRVRERRELESLPKVTRHIGKIEKELDGRGRLLVRFSGTEPVVRIMLEGENEKKISALAEGLAETIRESLGEARNNG
ncbi:MAG TPA: phosphoglucosamine mutase, partial [Nitrospiria bacterium]|nr:phosphoglucosamine mutase [Nitrospiria bacterium]